MVSSVLDLHLSFCSLISVNASHISLTIRLFLKQLGSEPIIYTEILPLPFSYDNSFLHEGSLSNRMQFDFKHFL